MGISYMDGGVLGENGGRNMGKLSWLFYSLSKNGPLHCIAIFSSTNSYLNFNFFRPKFAQPEYRLNNFSPEIWPITNLSVCYHQLQLCHRTRHVNQVLLAASKGWNYSHHKDKYKWQNKQTCQSGSAGGLKGDIVFIPITDISWSLWQSSQELCYVLMSFSSLDYTKGKLPVSRWRWHLLQLVLRSVPDILAMIQPWSNKHPSMIQAGHLSATFSSWSLATILLAAHILPGTGCPSRQMSCKQKSESESRSVVSCQFFLSQRLKICTNDTPQIPGEWW